MRCRCGPRHSHQSRLYATDGGSASRKTFDPTGTMPLQRKFERDMTRRWDTLRKLVPSMITHRTDAINTIAHAAATGQDPVRAFQSMLDRALKMVVVGTTRGWMLPYIRQAGDLALLRATSLGTGLTDAFEESKHPRAPDGKWASEGGSIKAFHGTTSAIAKKVMKSGLTVSGHTRSFGGDLYKDERGKAVFVANSFKTADYYARQRVWNKGNGQPAILELRVPKSEWKNFQKDTEHDGKGAAFSTKKIPAKWIVAVHKSKFYDAADDDHVSLWMVVEEDDGTNDARDPLAVGGSLKFIDSDATFLDVVNGTKINMVQTTWTYDAPIRHDRVPPLQTLAHAELQGIAEAVSQKAVRAFANGLLTKQSPASIGRDIQLIIDKTAKPRSQMLVGFIVVRTFSAVTLDSFRAQGIPTVGVMVERVSSSTLTRDAASAKSRGKKPPPKDLVEVLTAGDDKVCLVCEDISEGGPYSLDEAELLIPAHPRCRCAFVPFGDKRFARVTKDAPTLVPDSQTYTAAGIMFLDPEGRALFVRRASTGDHAGEWALPGGAIEPGETAEMAAIREAFEEVGLRTRGPLEEVDRRIVGGVDFTTFVSNVSVDHRLTLNHEHTDYVWLPLSDPPYPLHPGVAATVAHAVLADENNFDPSLHPRDKDGKWSQTAGHKAPVFSKKNFIRRKLRNSMDARLSSALDSVTDHLDQTHVEPEEFLSGMFPVPLTEKPVLKYDENSDVTVIGSLADGRGERIGGMQRSFNFQDREVTHQELVFHDAATAQGHAKNILRSQVDLYGRLGMKKINIHANVNVGGYAWARYGFTPDKFEWETTLRSQLSDRLPRVENREDRAALKKLVMSDDPRAAWAIADSKYGKQLLLDSDWFGSLDMSDSHTMSRFRSYVGAKK